MYTKYTGVILKKHPLGEADELLTIYTREIGKLRAKAVAVRRIQSKLAGNLQTLNEIDFETAGRYPPAGGLPVVISVRLRSMNTYLREDLKKFASALLGVETLYRMTPDGEPNPEIYEALVMFLRDLEVKKFQLRLLSCSGYRGVEEGQIDQMLQEILEREINSKKFLNSIT